MAFQSTKCIVDNALMLLIRGAMDAPLNELLFWASLALSLLVAGLAAFPMNRWLITRGHGHAVLHQYHGEEGPQPLHEPGAATHGRHHQHR